MRYFRYKNTEKNINNALKEQYKTLTEDEKRMFNREKLGENSARSSSSLFISL